MKKLFKQKKREVYCSECMYYSNLYGECGECRICYNAIKEYVQSNWHHEGYWKVIGFKNKPEELNKNNDCIWYKTIYYSSVYD